MNGNLKRSYLLLIALALLLAAANYFLSGVRVVAEYAPNLLSEILGILLTVFLIDRVITLNQERENGKFRMMGLRQLKNPLFRMTHLLLNMYKASAVLLPSPLPQDVDDLAGADFRRSVALLDLSRNAPVFPDMTWFNYLHHECAEFRGGLDGVIGKFGAYIGPDLVDMLIRLKDSGFVAFLLNARSVPVVDRKLGVTRPYTLLEGEAPGAMMEEFLREFARLVDAYNAAMAEEHQVSCEGYRWDDRVAPEIGSGRRNIS